MRLVIYRARVRVRVRIRDIGLAPHMSVYRFIECTAQFIEYKLQFKNSINSQNALIKQNYSHAKHISVTVSHACENIPHRTELLQREYATCITQLTEWIKHRWQERSILAAIQPLLRLIIPFLHLPWLLGERNSR